MSTTAPEDLAVAIEDLNPYEEPTTPNTRAHIINPPKNTHIWQPGMETQEIADIARMTGQEVVALCGHRWVPRHDPAALDVCEACLDLAQRMIAGEA